jgi:hypothetical protein
MPIFFIWTKIREAQLVAFDSNEFKPGEELLLTKENVFNLQKAIETLHT